MKRLSSTLILLAFTACSAGAGGFVPQAHPPEPGTMRSRAISLAFSLIGGLPKSGPAHKVASLTILPYGAHVKPQVWNLSKTACLAKKTCIFEVNTRGLSLFLVRSYEKRGGAGKLLSTTIVSRSNLTLVPTVRQAAIVVSNPNPAFGKKQLLFLAGVGLDRHGDAIVGPAPYDRSIELYVQGNMHISTRKVTNSTHPITLEYDGGYQYAYVSVPKNLAAFDTRPYVSIRPQLHPALEQASPLRPAGFAKAADGSLWLTDVYECLVAKMAVDFTTTPYAAPKSACPFVPTTGPDGNVWFLANGGIGYVTPSGAITTYADPFAASLAAITSGPDGKLWMVDNSNGNIYSATTSGVITKASYSLNKPYSADIVTGPDGNLWIPYNYGGAAGFAVVNTAGAFVANHKAIVIPPVIVGGRYIYGATSDQAMSQWNSAGKLVATYTSNEVNTSRSQLALGADGSIWFAISGGDDYRNPSAIFGRITSAGEYCEVNVPLPTTQAATTGDIENLISGSDGALYYTRDYNLGKITLPPTLAPK